MSVDIRKRTLNFLHWFNSVWESPDPVALSDVSQIMAPTIVFYLNGKLIAEGIHAYLERLNALKRNCKAVKINLPPESLIVQGNHAAVLWYDDLTYQDGSKHKVVNGGFFQFDDEGKIVKFSDVFAASDPVKH